MPEAARSEEDNTIHDTCTNCYKLDCARPTMLCIHLVSILCFTQGLFSVFLTSDVALFACPSYTVQNKPSELINSIGNS